MDFLLCQVLGLEKGHPVLDWRCRDTGILEDCREFLRQRWKGAIRAARREDLHWACETSLAYRTSVAGRTGAITYCGGHEVLANRHDGQTIRSAS